MGIDNEVVVTRAPTEGELGTGAITGEIKNQQLNEALASGTVDNILMTNNYVSTLNNNVVVRKELAGFATYSDIGGAIALSDLDFGWYDSSKLLQIKSNVNYSSALSTRPLLSELSVGEIAVDNVDGSIWTRRYYDFKTDGSVDGSTYDPLGIVTRINAGSVNGVVIDGSTYMSKNEIHQYVVDKINEAFVYDSNTNALTVKKVIV